MKRVFLATVLAAASLFAQKEEQVNKVIKLRFVAPTDVQNVVRMFGVGVSIDNQMKVIGISGTAAQVAAAEGAIKQFDVAPKIVELVVHFVVGTNQARPADTAPAPADLRDVIAQLKNTFNFKEYTMLDTLTVRTRAGSPAESSGILDASRNPRLTVFSLRSATVSEDGATIRIDRMHAGLRIPVGEENGKVQYTSTGIDQDVDVREGQKIVVGRSSLSGPDRALFVILTARIVQ